MCLRLRLVPHPRRFGKLSAFPIYVVLRYYNGLFEISFFWRFCGSALTYSTVQYIEARERPSKYDQVRNTIRLGAKIQTSKREVCNNVTIGNLEWMDCRLCCSLYIYCICKVYFSRKFPRIPNRALKDSGCAYVVEIFWAKIY